MALETQLVDIPLTGGLSTKLDAVIPDKGRLLALSNATFNKTGTLARRDSWQQLTGSTGISAVEVATLGNELLAIDGTTGGLYSYSPTSGAITQKGTPPQFRVGLDSIAANTAPKSGLDAASNGTTTCMVWLEVSAGGTYYIRYVVIDEATGATLASQMLTFSSLTVASIPRVCLISSVYLVAWQTSGNVMSVATVDATTGAILNSATPLAAFWTAGATINNYDLSTINSGGSVLLTIGFVPAATTYSVGCALLSSACVQSSGIVAIAKASFTGTTPTCVTATPVTSTKSVVMAGDGTAAAVLTAIVTYSGGSITAGGSATTVTARHPTAVTGILDPAGSNVYVFATGLPAADNVTTLTKFQVSSANAISGLGNGLGILNATGGIAGPTICGKAFVASSAIYFPVGISSTLQTSTFIMDNISSTVVSAVMLYGAKFVDTALASGFIPSTPNSGTFFTLPAFKQGSLSLTNQVNTTLYSVARSKLVNGRATTSIAAPAAWHTEAANCLYFSGSYMAMYDGARVAEAGFFYFPEGVTAVASGAGAIAGTFQVVAVYEWLDGKGQRHQSSPSGPVSVTLAGNTTITMNCPSLMLGSRAGSAGPGLALNTSIVFYRTLANGTTFYRVNSPTAPVYNNPSGATSFYVNVITAPDTISANEILYTAGGELPHNNPPACNAIAAWNGRVIYSNAEDPQDWRFSQYPQSGRGLSFNEALLMNRTPVDAGQITALGVMDDKCIVTTATRKLFVSGSGPASNGLGGTFSPPQLLPSDVGCVDQRSMVLLPDVTSQDGAAQLSAQGGLGHQTQHGYYLLDRALIDRYIGQPDDVNLNGATVSSACVMQDKHQLRLTTGSVVAVFDYLMGQWTTFTEPTLAAVPRSGCVWLGRWVFGTSGSGSGLFGDVAGNYLDLGTNVIVVSFTTAWIKPGSLQGFGRLRGVHVFGPYGGPSTVTLSAYQDYSTQQYGGMLSPILGVTTSPILAVSVSTSTVKTSDNLRWQVRWGQQLQKAEAYQFTITDTPTSGTYAGVGFSGLTLEVGVKRGPYKLTASKSV